MILSRVSLYIFLVLSLRDCLLKLQESPALKY